MNTLKYTATHEWLRNDNNEVTIGITEHAQHALGELVFVELPPLGNSVNAGDELGVVESVKAAADFYAPITGTIVAVNQNVCENPELVNKDPYDAGWLVKIRPSRPEEIEQLLDSEQYQNHLSEER